MAKSWYAGVGGSSLSSFCVLFHLSSFLIPRFVKPPTGGKRIQGGLEVHEFILVPLFLPPFVSVVPHTHTLCHFFVIEEAGGRRGVGSVELLFSLSSFFVVLVRCEY